MSDAYPRSRNGHGDDTAIRPMTDIVNESHYSSFMKEAQRRKNAVVLINDEMRQDERSEPGSLFSPAVSDRTTANWDDFKRDIRAKYPRLTPEDIDSTNGRMESIIATILEKYPDDLNFTREQIHSELGDVLTRYSADRD